MGKFTWRWLPFQADGIDYLESLLSDYARKGLLLEHTTGTFARFEKVEPCEVRYRLEPVSNDPDRDEDFAELCAKNGWDYVDSLGETFHIFMTRDSNAPELHTDPQLQAYALRKLYRKTIAGTVLIALLFIGYWGGLFWLLFRKGTPLLTLVGVGTVRPALILLFMILELGSSLYTSLHFMRVYRGLKQGQPMEHQPAYRRIAFLSTALFLLNLPFLFIHPLSNAISPPLQHMSYQDYTGGVSLPLLEELESRDDFSYDSLEYEGTNYANYIAVLSDPIAPNVLALKQTGRRDKPYEEAFLKTEYYEFRWEALAKRAYAELQARDSAEFFIELKPLVLPVGWEGVYSQATYPDNHSGFEDATGDVFNRETTDYQFAYLRSGCRAIMLCYHGRYDLRDLMPQIIAKLEA